jgi:hypothetical protein
MKQKLHNADELTVKYALNELDPSEAKLFERTLKDDQDLLIEAESQRRTWQRVSALPTIEPPAGLIEDTIRQAVAGRVPKRSRIFSLTPAWRWAAAASILAIVSFPLMDMITEAPIEAVSVEQAAPAPAKDDAPWVDRRDVLRLQQTPANTASASRTSTDSTAQLRPIDPNSPGAASQPVKTLQQTGAKSDPK